MTRCRAPIGVIRRAVTRRPSRRRPGLGAARKVCASASLPAISRPTAATRRRPQWRKRRRRSARARLVAIPEAARARAAAFVITAAEGASRHLGDLQRRAGDFDPATRDRFLAGALTPAAWVLQAQRFRRWFHGRMMEIFRDIDIILAPATPISAPLIGQETMRVGGADIAVRPNLGMFTQPLSFIGLPIVAVPVHRPGRLPIGIQVIAAPWREADALRAARALEQAGVAAAPVAA